MKDLPVEDVDPVKLEHRLTQIEGQIATGFVGIIGRLDTMNGKVGRHEEWINDQKLTARELKGFVEGRAALRKKDLAIVSSIVTALVGAVQSIPYIIRLAS